MRILKVYDGEYPWDVRVEKIVGSLISAGHEVRLVCRNRRGDPRHWNACSSGLELARLRGASLAPLDTPLLQSDLGLGRRPGDPPKYRRRTC